MTDKLLYTVAEVAEILNCSESHVRGLIRRGILPSKRVSDRKVFVPVKAFNAWLEAAA